MSKEIEKVVVVGRFAYIKLFDFYYDDEIYLDDGEYRQLFWHFYWRIV